MEDVIFIDSNIWCYYFNNSALEHDIIASTVDLVAEEEEIAINSVIIMEVAHYLYRQVPVKAGSFIDSFLSYPFHFFELDLKTVQHAIQVLEKYSSLGIGGRDATIIASMEISGIRRLMTNDKAFEHVKSIDVINPLNKR